MYLGKSIGVVVPAYNEEKHIGTVIATMPDLVDRIFVVDDCSSDATAAEAEAVGDRRVEVIRAEQNTGVGGAILRGHRRALETNMDVSVVMAGDGQMDPEALPSLLDPVASGRFGFAKANRFFSASSMTGMPRLRVFGNVVLSILNKAASGYWHLVDPQNGYTATSREALEQMPLDRIALGYEFENDWLVWLSINDVPATDVNVAARYQDEASGIRYGRVAFALLWLFFRAFWRRVWLKYVLWSFSPIALLLLSGCALLLFGLLVGLFVVITSVGDASATPGTALLAAAPAITGVYLLVQAMVMDVQASPGASR